MTQPTDGLRDEFHEYEQDLHELSAGLSRDFHAADDLVQDAFLTALEHPPEHRDDIRAWLRAVLRNLALREVRSRKRRHYWESSAAREGKTDDFTEELVRSADLERVHHSVDELPEPYQTVIRMRYLDEQPPREIAEELDRPLETVKSQLHRGIERLRERLQSEYGEEYAGIAIVVLLGLWPARTGGGAALGAPKTTWMTGKVALVALFLAIVGTVSFSGFASDGAPTPSTGGDEGREPQEPLVGIKDKNEVEPVPPGDEERFARVEVPEPVPGPPPAMLQVVLLDEQDRPIEGAEISAAHPPVKAHPMAADWHPLDRLTDADGRIAVELDKVGQVPPFMEIPAIFPLPDGRPRIGLVARKDGMESRTHWILPERAEEAEVTLRMDVSRPDLIVRVIDPEGNPVVGSFVGLMGEESDSREEGGKIVKTFSRRNAVSDKNGEALFRSVVTGYRLAVTPVGLGRFWEPLGTLEGESERRVIQVPYSRTIEGTVRGTDGSPLPGAAVISFGYGDCPMIQATSGPDGTYALEDMPIDTPIRLVVLYFADGDRLKKTETVVMEKSDESFEWSPVFGAGRRVAIRVWTADGETAPGKTIGFAVGDATGTVATITTDKDGFGEAFLNVADDDRVRILAEGPSKDLTVQVDQVDGYELTSGEIAIELPGDTATLRFEGCTIDGEHVPAHLIFLRRTSDEQVLRVPIQNSLSDWFIPAGVFEAAVPTPYGMVKLDLLTFREGEETIAPSPKVDTGTIVLEPSDDGHARYEILLAANSERRPNGNPVEPGEIKLLSDKYELREIRGANRESRVVDLAAGARVSVSFASVEEEE